MAEYRKEKYFWLKLKRDFFKRHDIRVVEDMPNGKEYILFYLKLLVESIDHEGELMFSETIPYNAEMLASVTNTNVDIVKAALQVFYDLNMIELLDSGALYLREVEALIGCQSISAEKKEIQLKNRRKKLEGGKKVENFPLELEKELEKELDIDVVGEKYGLYENVIIDDIDKLKEECPYWEHYIERLSSYMYEHNKTYKNHHKKIIEWYRQDEKANKLPQTKETSYDSEKYKQKARGKIEYIPKHS